MEHARPSDRGAVDDRGDEAEAGSYDSSLEEPDDPNWPLPEYHELVGGGTHRWAQLCIHTAAS